MKLWRITFLILTALFFAFCSSNDSEQEYPSTTDSAQLFHPLNLGFSGGERQGNLSQPRMHVEGDMLYICTSQGLYAKKLTDDNGVWQQAGFNGIPLQDYARRTAKFWPCATTMRAAVSCYYRTMTDRHTRM